VSRFLGWARDGLQRYIQSYEQPAAANATSSLPIATKRDDAESGKTEMGKKEEARELKPKLPKGEKQASKGADAAAGRPPPAALDVPPPTPPVQPPAPGLVVHHAWVMDGSCALGAHHVPHTLGVYDAPPTTMACGPSPGHVAPMMPLGAGFHPMPFGHSYVPAGPMVYHGAHLPLPAHSIASASPSPSPSPSFGLPSPQAPAAPEAAPPAEAVPSPELLRP